MRIFDVVPFRAWVGVVFLVAGLAVAYGAVTRIEGMRDLLDIAEGRGATVSESTGAAGAVIGIADLSLDQLAARLSHGLKRPEDVAEVAAMRRAVEQAGEDVARGEALAIMRGYAAFAGVSCAMRPQRGSNGRLKALPVGEDAHRLSVACWSSDGAVIYPAVAQMMPVVSTTTLDEIERAGGTPEIGFKSAEELRIRWDIQTLETAR